MRVRVLARICSEEERLRELLLTRREEIPKIWLTSLMNGPKGKKEEVGGSSGGWPNCSFYPTIALAGRRAGNKTWWLPWITCEYPEGTEGQSAMQRFFRHEHELAFHMIFFRF